MPITKLLGKLLGGSSGGVEMNQYECTECGYTFRSAKRPERSQCAECLSSDVDLIGTAEAS